MNGKKKSRVVKSEERLFGLILSGGESRRMNADKSLLKYHGKPQIEFLQELLTPFCDRVFISTRKEQLKNTVYQRFPHIHDAQKFAGIGPLGGMLSAMNKFPKVSWLIVACDLPFLSGPILAQLLARRNLQKYATAFRSRYDDLPEPLCAIYEPSAQSQWLKFFNEGIHCPRKILIRSEKQIELLPAPNDAALDNINTPEEYSETLKALKKNGATTKAKISKKNTRKLHHYHV